MPSRRPWPAAPLGAAQPAWWTNPSPNTAILTPGATPNPLGPVNQGQLKNVAKKAALYLNTALPGRGAGGLLDARVNAFQPSASDHTPVNLGQLKAVAKPFYDRLMELGFNTQASLQAHNKPGAPAWTLSYPWNPATELETNLAPANLGQLKWVFSFDLTGFSVVDTDGDGLPDTWETTHGTSPTDPDDAKESDADGDGLPDWWEFLHGTLANNSDSDGNGMPDCFDDFDGDGLSNEAEAAFSLDPNSKDTDGDSMPDDWELANDFDPKNASDGSEDTDEDGTSNAEEYSLGAHPLEGVDPDHERKIELFWRWWNQQWILQGDNWEWSQEYEMESVDDISEGTIVGPGMKSFGTSGLIIAWLEPDLSRYRTQVRFKNHGPSPAYARWIQAEETLDVDGWQADSLTEESVLIPANSTSVRNAPYPSSGKLVMLYYNYRAKEDQPEQGFDSFERWTAAGETPKEMNPPWLMQPAESGQTGQSNPKKHFKFDAESFVGAAVVSTNSSVEVRKDPSNIQRIEVETKTTITSTTLDDQIVLTGRQQTAAEGVPIVRLAILPKIECVVNLYIVTLRETVPVSPKHPSGYMDLVPVNIPSDSEIADRLNQIYQSQMNVHFTVNRIPLGPVNYDRGMKNLTPDQEQEDKDNANGLNNLQLDFSEKFDDSLEEKTLYDSSLASVVNVNIYILPTGIYFRRTGSPLGDSYFNTGHPYRGWTRYQQRVAWIAGISFIGQKSSEVLENLKQDMKETIAHEIGHLGLGKIDPKVDRCLAHPYEKQDNYNKLSNFMGFPLRPESSNFKRLMWRDSSSRTGMTLIYDEWLKFRASKP